MTDQEVHAPPFHLEDWQSHSFAFPAHPSHLYFLLALPHSAQHPCRRLAVRFGVTLRNERAACNAL